MAKSRSVFFKIVAMLVIGCLAGQPVSLAASAAADDLQWYSDGALDYLDKLINLTQIRDIKKQLQKGTHLLINPYFKAGFDFTNNVFRAPDNTPDEIWTFTPGVTVTATGSRARLGFSYEADFRYFSHQTKQNTQDQKFSALGEAALSENLFLRASERISQTGATAGRTGLEPVDYLDHIFNVMTGYHYGTWLFEVGYENFVRNYQHQIFDRLDYNDNRLITRLSAEVAENFKEYLEFSVGHVDFPDISTRDAAYFEILPGVEGRLPGNVTVVANVGYHRRNLEKDARNDLDMAVASLILKKQLQPRTSGEVMYSRRPQEGSFDAQTFYLENLVYAGLSHLFTKKLRGKTGVSFAERSYQGVSTVGAVAVKRRDDVFGFNAALDYAARKWFVITLGYLLERRNSNISDFDYTENRLSLGVTVPV